jgi:hypothetical protein
VVFAGGVNFLWRDLLELMWKSQHSPNAFRHEFYCIFFAGSGFQVGRPLNPKEEIYVQPIDVIGLGFHVLKLLGVFRIGSIYLAA